MQMRHANTQTLDPAATYVATVSSCWQKSFGFSRRDENQALARRCSR
jgi:hypothetical protein